MSRVYNRSGPKIEREQAVPGRPRSGKAHPVSFGSNLNSARIRQVRENLEHGRAAIGHAAARLAADRTLANLNAYKSMVKEFLATAQREAMAVQTELDWDYRAWEQRTLTIVCEIDAELNALAELVLADEADRLEVLAKTGEITGLLLDIRI